MRAKHRLVALTHLLLISFTRLYDKRDDFNFTIVNVPFLSSNIPSTPAYGVNVSQLVRYCFKYQDFTEEGSCLPINCCHRVIAERCLYQQLKAL